MATVQTASTIAYYCTKCWLAVRSNVGCSQRTTLP